jgi:hypothetical protein
VCTKCQYVHWPIADTAQARRLGTTCEQNEVEDLQIMQIATGTEITRFEHKRCTSAVAASYHQGLRQKHVQIKGTDFNAHADLEGQTCFSSWRTDR